jgi:hypothetical protein
MRCDEAAPVGATRPCCQWREGWLTLAEPVNIHQSAPSNAAQLGLGLSTNPDQVRGKLRRAILVIEEFRLAELEFIRGKSTEARPGPAGTLVIEMKSISDRFSAIAEDALQNLRSALHHDVYRMSVAAKERIGPVSPGVRSRCTERAPHTPKLEGQRSVPFRIPSKT